MGHWFLLVRNVIYTMVAEPRSSAEPSPQLLIGEKLVEGEESIILLLILYFFFHLKNGDGVNT